MVFVSATEECAYVEGTVTCLLGDLAAGHSGSVVIVVDAAKGGAIANRPTVTADQADPNPANNSPSEDTADVSPAADLIVSAVRSPEVVLAGDQVTYEITVSNNGPADATGVTIIDTLPRDASFVSANEECSHVDGAVTCLLGDLGVGQSASGVIVVNAAEAGTITNRVSVTADQADPNSANNSSTDTAAVSPAATAPTAPTATPTVAPSPTPAVIPVTPAATPVAVPPAPGGGLSIGTIIGIIAGVVIATGTVGWVIIAAYRRKRRTRDNENSLTGDGPEA